MPRRPAIEPNFELHTTLPPKLATRVELLLFSEAEGRVPRGAWQRFLTNIITEFFSHRKVDVGVFMNRQPGEILIQGSDHAISTLIHYLKEVPQSEPKS
jgi:hypothetical protein